VKIGLGVGASVVFGFSFFFALVYVPSDVHDKQEKINKEQDELINPKVKLEFSPYHPEGGENGVRWAGVYIHNLSGVQAIQQCKAQLLSFEPNVRGVNNLPSDLMWSDNNRPDSSGFLKIDRDGTAILYVVVSYENYSGGTVTLRRGGGIIVFPPGTYTITFKINGTINSNDFDPQIYSASIILEQGKDIRIENISKRSES